MRQFFYSAPADDIGTDGGRRATWRVLAIVGALNVALLARICRRPASPVAGCAISDAGGWTGWRAPTATRRGLTR